VAQPAATPVAQPKPAPAPVVVQPAPVAKVDSSAQKQEATPVAVFEPVNLPPEPKKVHPMNMIHGNAYNIVGNEAAAPTIGGDMYIPHKMHGHRLGYFEPINGEGVVSFGQSTTGFLAFDNSADLGLLTAGIARSSFGISFDAALAKNWSYIDDDANASENTTITSDAGNLYGLTLSGALGNVDLALKGYYANPDDEIYTSENGVENNFSLWDAGAKFIISNTSNSGFAWTFAISGSRYYSHVETTEKEYQTIDGTTYLTTRTTRTTDSTTHVEIVPEFNFGSAVLEAEKGRIFLGLNTNVPILIFDHIKDVCSRHREYGLYMTPNILGEVSLSKYFMAFGSAAHQWEAIAIRDSYMRDVSVKTIDTRSGVTTVNLGARFQYEMAALEMVFTQEFLQNPFGSFSDHDAMAFSIGAFINF